MIPQSFIQDLLNRVAPLLGFNDYIDLNPLAAGIGTLGFIFGAYLSETFRGAFMAIPKGQAEAGMAYGMNSFQVFFRVLVPQMIRLAIPGFTNNWLVLTKATALMKKANATRLFRWMKTSETESKKKVPATISVETLIQPVKRIMLGKKSSKAGAAP